MWASVGLCIMGRGWGWGGCSNRLFRDLHQQPHTDFLSLSWSKLASVFNVGKWRAPIWWVFLHPSIHPKFASVFNVGKWRARFGGCFYIHPSIHPSKIC